MNKIETLLKELCPNGVEWESLGESCEIANSGRKPVKSSLRESGDIPYYGANNIQDYVNGFTHDGDYILIAEDGSASLENYSVQRVKGKFWANNHVHVIRGKDKVINGFLFHYFKYMNFSAYLTGGTRAKLTKGKLIEIKIPIPPLEIQEEIVKILDKFTDYVTELTTELTLRQKQYHYYRDMLLSFEDEFYQVKWKCLEDLCDVRDGTHDSPIKQNSGKLLITSKNIKNGCVSYKDAYYISQEDFNSINVRSKVDKDDILFTMIGTVGEIAHVTSEPDYAIKNVGLIKTGNKVFARYLFHYLQSSLAKKYIEDNKSKGSQVFLALGKIRKFPIPYIDTKIQSRIVQVLDNFDAVCNDLNIGLPKEIELRQKQYEFFRDKLLTFAAEGVYTDSTVQYSTDKT